jgi:uncharacterized alpha-E superfamily protein
VNANGRPLLSRVADSIYWMARYIERAENVARYIGVTLQLQLDLPLARAHQWQPLIDTSGDTEDFKERYGEPTQANVIEFLAYDASNSNSIVSCLRLARENARSVREIISSEMWTHINSMYLNSQAHASMPEPGRLLDTFRDMRMGCHTFQGICDATMTHNEAWHFLRLGRKLERADKTSRILDVKYFMLLPSARDVGTPYDDIHWAAVLKSVSGFQMYRQKYGRLTPRGVVDFLVLDREFPRSMNYCIREAGACLRAITGSPESAPRFRSEQLLTPICMQLHTADVDQIIGEGLHEYLDGLQLALNEVDITFREEFVTQSHLQSQIQNAGQSQSQSQSQFLVASSPLRKS